jgi:hypothetical protein
MILEGITQGEDIDPRFPGKNLYRLLLAVDDIDSAQAAHAWIADIKAMYGVMVRFLRRICDSVYIGPNAYPIRYAALYDPSQPDMIIEECHRWGVYCRPEEEGGCVCCAAGTPKGTREEYINSKACTFGLFDHPDFRQELIGAVKRAYARSNEAIQLPADAGTGDTKPMAILNGLSIGPQVDRYIARTMVGGVHTVDCERLLGELKHLKVSDKHSFWRTFSMIYKGATSFSDGVRRAIGSVVYSETRSKAARKAAASAMKYDREGYFAELLEMQRLARDKQAHDLERQAQRAEHQKALAEARAARQEQMAATAEQRAADRLKVEAERRNKQVRAARRKIVGKMPSIELVAALTALQVVTTDMRVPQLRETLLSSESWSDEGLPAHVLSAVEVARKKQTIVQSMDKHALCNALRSLGVVTTGASEGAMRKALMPLLDDCGQIPNSNDRDAATATHTATPAEENTAAANTAQPTAGTAPLKLKHHPVCS